MRAPRIVARILVHSDLGQLDHARSEDRPKWRQKEFVQCDSCGCKEDHECDEECDEDHWSELDDENWKEGDPFNCSACVARAQRRKRRTRLTQISTSSSSSSSSDSEVGAENHTQAKVTGQCCCWCYC